MEKPASEFATGADQLRMEMRTWLEAHFPSALADPERRETEPELVARWRADMDSRGWGMPEWPVAYGGGGLSPEEATVLREEIVRIGAYNPIGDREQVFGETLKEYGTEEQKRFHLPPMLRGEVYWCQGFSEPGAGSDLAGLQMRAEETPEGFVLNGQKIWTSGALKAQWCFCLVKTDTRKKHDGISFILIDMATPGFEVRPLRLIDGTEPFCELFLTDVLVPKENILGEINGGWEVARYQLQVERRFVASSARHGTVPGPALHELAKERIGVDGDGRLADGDLRARIAEQMMYERARELTHRRAGGKATASILKNVGSVARQLRAELTVEVLGQQGLGWSGDNFSDNELAITRTFLFGKSNSIAAGTYEVQNNIIARRTLGLPDANSRS